MSWFCSVCEKSFSRKDSMQRYVMSKHRNSGLTPFQTVPIFSQKRQRFRFEHPFTSMIAGMTGSGKTAWVRSLLQQASETIYPSPERIVWCYSQWQPAYTQMLVAMPHIEFVKGIPTALEQDSYFDVNKSNLIVSDDQMIDASKDKRIVNLFTRGSHHRNLSVIYTVQNLFHQGKGSRSKSKQPLSGVIQESTRKIANLNSGEANVSRGDGFLFKSVRRDCKKTFWLSSD